MRAFLAARRAAGIGSRSLMRTLAGIRGFARFLERGGKGKVGALAAVRAPKLGKTLPRPLPVDAAKGIVDPDLAAGDGRDVCKFIRATPPCWRCSMAAVCASPKRLGFAAQTFDIYPHSREAEIPDTTAKSSVPVSAGTSAKEIDAITVTGKGRKNAWCR